MPARRRVASLALFALLASCAPTVYRSGTPPQRIESSMALVRAHIAAAKVMLNEAALAGNIAGVLGRFTPGAVLVVEQRDTLRGRAAIAAWITAHADGKAAARVEMRSDHTWVCADGAIELAGTMLTRLGGRDDIAPLNALYVAKWRDDGVEGWRIDRMEAMRQFEREPSLSAYCASFDMQQFDARRVFVTLSAGPRMHAADAGNSMEAGLRANGYTPGALVLGLVGYDSDSPRDWDERLLTVRATVWRQLWLQAILLPQEQPWARRGASGATQVGVTMRVKWNALLAGWSWGRWRAGAGVVGYDADWSVVTENPLPPFSGPFSARGAQRPVGLMVEGAFAYPLSNWFFIEARLQHRTGSLNMDGAGTYRASTVSLADTRLQLHFGFAVY